MIEFSRVTPTPRQIAFGVGVFPQYYYKYIFQNLMYLRSSDNKRYINILVMPIKMFIKMRRFI